jgi:hypothetical protein
LRRVAIFLTDVEIQEKRKKMLNDVFATVLGLGSLGGSIAALSYCAASISMVTGGAILFPLGIALFGGLVYAGKWSKGELR